MVKHWELTSEYIKQLGKHRELPSAHDSYGKRRIEINPIKHDEFP